MWDTGEWFVVEADESDRTFLSIDAEVVVVTSVESDHLETYHGTPAALVDAFGSFLASARYRVVCADDPVAARLGSAAGAVTYGTDPDADFRMSDVSLQMPVSAFDLYNGQARLGRITLPTPGLHNARNAAAAVVTAMAAGASFDDAARALARFGGVARRFEFRGDVAGVTFVDDYAHLPSEVAAALAAARTGDWRRVVCVFQPHRYSRIASIGADFAHSFTDSDHLVLTGIYPAGEAPRPGVTSKIVPRRGARRPSVVVGDVAAPARRGRRLAGRPAAPRRPLPDARRRRPHVGTGHGDRAPRSPAAPPAA